MTLELVKPALPHLPEYRAALETGRSADNVRGADAAREELAKIVADPAAFVARLDDPQAKSGPVILPDGSTVARLPGFRRWLWDGAFCGSIGFRWRRGTTALPDYCLGHIGYAVVPWKRGRGYATRGLALLLDEIRREVGARSGSDRRLAKSENWGWPVTENAKPWWWKPTLLLVAETDTEEPVFPVAETTTTINISSGGCPPARGGSPREASTNSGQYQQNPVDLKGGIFVRDWWQRLIDEAGRGQESGCWSKRPASFSSNLC